MNDLQLFEQDIFVKNALDYPMLKLAQDIVQKYPVKYITPFYHWLLGLDGNLVLSGYHICFDNDVILSVQFGGSHYCTPRDKRLDMMGNVNHQFSFLEMSIDAEIAIIKDGELTHYDEWGDSVLGYQTPDEIMQMIEIYIYPSN